MYRSIPRAVLLMALAASAGCQLTPNFETGYAVEPWGAPPANQRGSLAVHDFEENRPARVYSTAGKIFLTYVPFIPYVSLPFERFDESVRIQSDAIERGGRGITLGADQNVAPPFEEYTYPASFSRAVAEDLAASGLFSQVDHVGTGPSDGYDYVLTGSVVASPLRRSVSSFGLGMPGVLLWLLPVPMAKTTGEATVTLELRAASSGQVVWADTLESSVHRYFTIYTSSAMVYGRSGAFSLNLEPPPSDAGVDRRSLFGWHFAALRRAMLEARPALGAALGADSAP